jgi:hypothetical protein
VVANKKFRPEQVKVKEILASIAEQPIGFRPGQIQQNKIWPAAEHTIGILASPVICT